VTVDKEKMSKSLGNFFTLTDIFKKHDPRTVRFLLLSHHYKGPLEFRGPTPPRPKPNWRKLKKIFNAWTPRSKIRWRFDQKKKRPLKRYWMGLTALWTALAENFNSPRVIALVFALLGELKARVGKENRSGRADWKKGSIWCGRPCGTFWEWESGGVDAAPRAVSGGEEDAIVYLVEQRQQARQAKNWAEADRLRAELAAREVTLEDTPQGPRWWKKK
jgi:cysteinyl-tRNA synthetase